MKDLGKFMNWFTPLTLGLYLLGLELNDVSLDVPGYGKGYNMAHKDVSHLTYMPKGLENIDFFGPSASD
jgi:hypothetical protein